MSGTHLLGVICATLAFVAVATIGNVVFGLSTGAFAILGIIAFLIVRQGFVGLAGSPSPRK